MELKKPSKKSNLTLNEKIKERFGETSLSCFKEDKEKLELLLSFLVPEKILKETTEELIFTYGNLDNILKLNPRDLEIIPGIGKKNSLFFRAICELHQEMFIRKFTKETVVINSKSDVVNYLNKDLIAFAKNKIGYEERESLLVLYLNSANHLLNHGELKNTILFTGTIDRSAIYPREIVARFIKEHMRIDNEVENKFNTLIEKCGTISLRSGKRIIEEAIKLKAKSVIIVHNHPSGSLKPSRSDVELTRNLKSLLENLDLRLLDHLIVTRDSFLSFLEEGLLD